MWTDPDESLIGIISSAAFGSTRPLRILAHWLAIRLQLSGPPQSSRTMLLPIPRRKCFVKLLSNTRAVHTETKSMGHGLIRVAACSLVRWRRQAYKSKSHPLSILSFGEHLTLVVWPISIVVAQLLVAVPQCKCHIQRTAISHNNNHHNHKTIGWQWKRLTARDERQKKPSKSNAIKTT